MHPLGAVVFVVAAASTPPGRELRLVMGTAAEVQVSGLADPRPALDAAFAALDRVDQRMSLWKSESELSRLNARGRAHVSPELLLVLRAALELARDSGGAFDPTVEPLVRAAGHLGEPARGLTSQELAALLTSVGHSASTSGQACPWIRAPASTWVSPGIAADRPWGAAAGRRPVGRGGPGGSLAVFGRRWR